MPEVDGCGAILVNAETAQLVPCTADESVLKSFRIAAAMRDFVNTGRDLIGAAVQPNDPKPTTARIVYEESN
jgi:hypothetical protein